MAVSFRAFPGRRLECQKTFTRRLTPERTRDYIASIDAAADANGAKHLLGSRTEKPDVKSGFEVRSREVAIFGWQADPGFENFEIGVDKQTE